MHKVVHITCYGGKIFLYEYICPYIHTFNKFTQPFYTIYYLLHQTNATIQVFNLYDESNLLLF